MRREDVEFELLREALRLRYGYDLRGYAEASLARRFEHVRRSWGASTLSQVQDRVLSGEDEARLFFELLTVTTTELFRDPRFFVRLREEVVPYLATFPSFNVWIAGCSTGEEAYSLAILLAEEGLLPRATLYATDINPAVLRAARSGVYGAEIAKPWPRVYALAGCKGSLHDHLAVAAGAVRFSQALRDRVVFAEHNLVTDDIFIECHLVLCRNVLIYFRKEQQDEVVRLFSRALRPGAFLGLGEKESLRFLPAGSSFLPVEGGENLFRRKPERPLGAAT